ncbi:MAG TPA: triose-phosphate isomerase [Bacteroidota bacterium]|nr:triose-phosphate isomerase [Bacteroidota bacterium]
MRKKLIAGNWKMNKDIHETAVLMEGLKERLKNLYDGVGVAVCPPFPSLVVAKSFLEGTSIALGAQNMSQHDDGAYTGEVSAKMLTAIGCTYVILGHSERRQYFRETDEQVNAKVKKALKAGLQPIICVGETLEERESGVTEKIITVQIKGVLHELTASDIGRTVIAYEPVWAIGTGKTATPDQANQVHKLIRKLVAQTYERSVADALIIQYGGSMNAENAQALLSQSDIDGGLIGGASLKPEAFAGIVQAARAVSRPG